MIILILMLVFYFNVQNGTISSKFHFMTANIVVTITIKYIRTNRKQKLLQIIFYYLIRFFMLSGH